MTKDEVLKRINSNTDWYPKSYSGFLFGIDIQAKGLSQGAKEIPWAMSYGVVYQNKTRTHHWDWFWDSNEMRAKRNTILGAARNDPTLAESFFTEWNQRYKEYVQHFEKSTTIDFDVLSDEQTLDYFRELYRLCVRQAAYGYVVDAFLTDENEDWLEKEIKNELKDHATAETIAQLTAPVFSSFVNDFNHAIAEVAGMINAGQDQREVEAAIDRIEREYFWIRTNYLDYQRLTKEDIRTEAQKLAAAMSSQADPGAKDEALMAKERKQRIFEELAVSKELRNVISVAEHFTHIQDRRKECVLRNNTLFYEALVRLAKRKNLDPTLVFYLFPEEFFQLLAGKDPDWTSVSRRLKEGVMVLYYEGTSTALYREEITSTINIANLFPDLGTVAQLKGTVAFKGNVRGRVQVLRTTKDISAFPEGYILVANQTTPEFVPAMKKAAAIVTDQGGITCHAALVSRELRVPCVIGTKNATKVLKDGDMVEVDAEQGIVRKVG